MSLNLSKPILYLITPGATAETTTRSSEEFQKILRQVSAAVAAGIQLIQLREKNLTARVLFELTERVMAIVRGTATKVLVNDRADIAAGAAADGVHLTVRSLEADVVRKTFGANLLIGVSTHSHVEACRARDAGANFVVFGPVFPTQSKKEYGPPLGIGKLSEVAHELALFPVLAIGGISNDNAGECLRAGASGVAAITLFSEPETLKRNAEMARKLFTGVVR
jgi:thiamine-phosphate pyrophosphorylase